MPLPDDVLTALIPEEKEWAERFGSFLREGGELASERTISILSQFFRKTPVGVVIVNASGNVLFINPAGAEMLGWHDRGDKTPTWREIRALRVMKGSDDVELTDDTDPLAIALTQKLQTTRDISFSTPDTEVEDWITVTAFPLFGDFERKKLIGAAMSMIDISDYMGMQEMLYHQATHDQLTGLANRSSLSAAILKSVAEARRDEKCGAVLLVGLDDFKIVNEQRGHAVGDLLLSKIADRMISAVRDTDVVARIGGDEFAVLLAEVDKDMIEKIAGDVATRMCRCASRPFATKGGDISITASVGVCIYPEYGADEKSLLNNANTAMREAKNAGKNCWRFYKPN